jgi:hypothetical protein
MDFNDANPQRVFDVIPAGAIAELHMTVRPRNAGEDGLLRRSKDGNSEALDCEFTVVRGPYAKRKFWNLMTVSGTTDGHTQAAEISRGKLRAILESARGFRPDDMSETAKQARVAGLQDFHGMRFVGRIGVEPAHDNYPAKNILLDAVTPDRQDWHRVEQLAKQPSEPTAPAAANAEPAKIARPAWAKS